MCFNTIKDEVLLLFALSINTIRIAIVNPSSKIMVITFFTITYLNQQNTNRENENRTRRVTASYIILWNTHNIHGINQLWFGLQTLVTFYMHEWNNWYCHVLSKKNDTLTFRRIYSNSKLCSIRFSSFEDMSDYVTGLFHKFENTWMKCFNNLYIFWILTQRRTIWCQLQNLASSENAGIFARDMGLIFFSLKGP